MTELSLTIYKNDKLFYRFRKKTFTLNNLLVGHERQKSNKGKRVRKAIKQLVPKKICTLFPMHSLFYKSIIMLPKLQNLLVIIIVIWQLCCGVLGLTMTARFTGIDVVTGTLNSPEVTEDKVGSQLKCTLMFQSYRARQVASRVAPGKLD